MQYVRIMQDGVNHSHKCKPIPALQGLNCSAAACQFGSHSAMECAGQISAIQKPPAHVGPPTSVSCKYALTIHLQPHQSWQIWQGSFVGHKECKHSWSRPQEPSPPISCCYTCRTKCIKSSFGAVIVLMTPMSFPTAITGWVHDPLIKYTQSTHGHTWKDPQPPPSPHYTQRLSLAPQLIILLILSFVVQTIFSMFSFLICMFTAVTVNYDLRSSYQGMFIHIITEV